MNKVILMGRLTADPDYRQTPQGTSVCRFTIAVNRNYVSKETGQRETDFISVEAWRNTADFVARYFKKGKPILVEGSLKNNDYTDQNGIKHYSMRVQADTINFCLTDNSPNNNAGNYNNYQQGGYGNSNTGYQSGYNNGGYNNSGYGQNNYAPQSGNNGYYQSQPQQPTPPVYQQQPATNSSPVPSNTQNNDVSASNDSVQIGSLDDFEEILSDGEIPF